MIGVLIWRNSPRWPLQELNKMISTYICDVAFKTFIVVGSFKRPWVDASHLDRPILADENVLRPDVPHLPVLAVEVVGSTEQSQHQVPQLILLKIFGPQTLPVVDLIRQQEGIVFVVNLNKLALTSTTPDDPQYPCLLKEWLLGSKRA